MYIQPQRQFIELRANRRAHFFETSGTPFHFFFFCFLFLSLFLSFFLSFARYLYWGSNSRFRERLPRFRRKEKNFVTLFYVFALFFVRTCRNRGRIRAWICLCVGLLRPSSSLCARPYECFGSARVFAGGFLLQLLSLRFCRSSAALSARCLPAFEED